MITCTMHTVGYRFEFRSPEEAFGLVLRSVRKARGMTQGELARKSGYHNNFICLLEKGRKTPSLRTFIDISTALGVPASWMLKQVERCQQQAQAESRVA